MIGDYLDQQISIIDGISLRQWTNELVLPRDFLHYLWLVTYRAGSNPSVPDIQMVPKSRVLAYLGRTMETTLDDAVDVGELRGFVELVQDASGNPVLRVRTNDLAEVEIILDKHYGVASSIPYLNLDGHRFVRDLNNTSRNLRQQVQDAFLEALNDPNDTNPNVQATPLDQNTTFLLEHREQGWLFLVSVRHDSDGVTNEEMHAFCHAINMIRGQTMNARNLQRLIPVLLLAPDPEDTNAFNAAAYSPGIYHLWPLGWLRFLIQLKKKIFDVGYTKSDVSKVFNALFPPNEIAPILELRAIDRIWKALQESGAQPQKKTNP
jgi:hypothetical protein